MFEQLKAGSELAVKSVWSVPNDVEPAALARTVWTKGCDDDVPSGFDRVRDLLHVRLPVLWIRQKMKEGSVVPYIVSMGSKGKAGDIATQPRYVDGSVAKSCFRNVQRG